MADQDRVFVLGEQDAAILAEMKRRVWSQPPRRGPSEAPRIIDSHSTDVQHHAWVVINSTTMTSGYYPGQWCLWDPMTRTMIPQGTSGDIWVRPGGGQTLKKGVVYRAFEEGSDTALADDKPVFLVEVRYSWLKITTTTQTDGRYPGTLCSYDALTSLFVDGDAGTIWVETASGEDSLGTSEHYFAERVGSVPNADPLLANVDVWLVDDAPFPAVHVALTPGGGIPALGYHLTGTSTFAAGDDAPGSASCTLFRLVAGQLKPTGLTKLVHNLSPYDIAGGVYVLAIRDVHEDWYTPERGGIQGSRTVVTGVTCVGTSLVVTTATWHYEDGRLVSVTA